MIEFTTLLIGLVTGSRAVELAVQEPVAIVEILLDGQIVGELESPPWRLVLDLGHQLEPHRIEARALDTRGSLIASTHQLINYARSSFEATIVLDSKSGQKVRTGKVVWDGALDDPPLAIELKFDSLTISVDRLGRFALPLHDGDQIHVLEAVVFFDEQHSAQATLTFGGLYGSQVTSALTALPLQSSVGRPWTAGNISRWLEADSKPVEIFKISSDGGRLVVLRESRIDHDLKGLGLLEESPSEADHDPISYQVSAISPLPVQGHEGTFRLTDHGQFGSDQSLQNLILQTRALVPRRGSDGRYLRKRGQKIWDALAVAGRDASAIGRPRAVLLMLDSDERDKSSLEPQNAVEYLRRVNVPLFIWAPDDRSFNAADLKETPRIYLGSSEIDRLCQDIGQEIESQTIVWIQGEYIPSEVTLTRAVPIDTRFAN